MSSRLFAAPALLLALILFLNGCGPSCAAQAGPFLQEAEALHGRWQGALARAERIDGNDLRAQLDALQAIKDEAEAIRVPSCAVVTKDALLAHMDFTLRGYELRQEGGSATAVWATAREWLAIYEANVAQWEQEQAYFPLN